jgi:hypothetical protein
MLQSKPKVLADVHFALIRALGTLLMERETDVDQYHFHGIVLRSEDESVQAPLLQRIGGVATWGDAFMLVGSIAGQLLMVLQKIEAWPVWIVVNTVGAVLYASQGLYFTSLFYAVLILMAVAGWRAWSSRSPATTVASPAPAGA